jgi:hypothetical protein
MSNQQPEWKPGQPPPWDQPGYGQQPPTGYGQQPQTGYGQQPMPGPGGPPPVPWTPQPQQQPRRPSFVGQLVRIGIGLAIVGGFALGIYLFRDRLGGKVTDLQVGDCFDVPIVDVDIKDVQHQPCTEPHDAEVFMLVSATGAAYPLESSFRDLARSQCLPVASTYLGADFNSRLDVDAGFFYPTRASWNDGDRGMTCYLHALPEGRKLTAPLKNSGPSGPSTAPSSSP